MAIYDVNGNKIISGDGGSGGQPIPVEFASEMSDTECLYLYLGTEASYQYGHVYAYVSSAWTDTGLYGKGQDGAPGKDGTATDEQVESYVTAWLDEHPDATTTVEDKSISDQKLSDSLVEKLGIERDARDKSIDIRELATVKPAKWNNGSPTYSSGFDCVEFYFDTAAIKAELPTNLSRGVDLMLFGINDAATYYTKYRVIHDGTIYSPDTNTNRTGKRVIPLYDDCAGIYVYVFGMSAYTDADIDAANNDLTAKVCDIIYAPVKCGDWITPAYGLQSIAVTFYDFGDETVKYHKIKKLAHITGTQMAENSFGVLDSTFYIVNQVTPVFNYLRHSDYILWITNENAAVEQSDKTVSFDWNAVTFVIPANENVTFFYVRTSYITDETEVLTNSGLTQSYFPTDEDIAFLKERYPYLKKYKGQFDREINFGREHCISTVVGPSIYTKEHAFFDLIRNGEIGDWYTYDGVGDFWIKNKLVTWGDIVYKRDANTYLALENPIKWGNYKTKAPEKYDIVIVGAGAGGIGAAYALRDSGLRVLVADKMPGLGGTHTQAGLHTLISSPIGDWYKPVVEDGFKCSACRFQTYNAGRFKTDSGFDDYWAATQATYKNVSNSTISYQTAFNPNWLAKRYNDDLKAGGIEVRYQRKFLRHNDIGGEISSLTFQNLITGAEEKVYAKVVIDCTADVHVGRYNRTLDTDYFIGCDPRNLYNEPAAPNIESGDHYDINTCEIMYLYSFYRGTGSILDDWAGFTIDDEFADKNKDFPTIDGVTSKVNGYYDLYYYADPGDVQGYNPFSNTSYFKYLGQSVSPDRYCGITAEMLVDYGEDALHEIAEKYARAHYKVYRKNSSNFFAKAYPLMAIRESYRMNCEYMVTQSDIEDTITSANYQEKNIVSLASWYADIHKSKYTVGDINSSFRNGVPYLALVPKSYKNLLVACRGYGASHIGLSGIRLIKNMMGLGRAAGFAAKQYVENGLQDIRDVDVSQVQTDAGVGELLNYLETKVYPYIDAQYHVTPSVTSMTVAEGSSDTFTVTLDAAPAVDQTVTVTSSDTSAMTVSPASLTFTPENYNSPQTVTVSSISSFTSANITLAVTYAVNKQSVVVTVTQ